MAWGIALILSVWGCARGHAQCEPTDSACILGHEPEPAPSTAQWLKPGVLAAGVAVFPGFVLHGAGSFAVGQRQTARKLLFMQAGGIAAFVGAGALIAVTGTARKLIGPLVPITIGGFGLFMLSWLADIYAASTGGREAHAPTLIPHAEAELGYLYVYDPQFAYTSFVAARGDVRAGALRISPEALVAVDDDNQRFGLEFAYRARGHTPKRRARDGSYADLAVGLRYHRFGSEHFAVWTPEAHLTGRLDLARLGDSLRGSFVEGQLGAGFELYDFDVPGSKLADNGYGLLLARMGFGVYFGQELARSGELVAYYDHRRDDFAAGLGVRGVAGGVLGHFGLRGHYNLTRHWGATALFEVGSAYVAGLNVRYRYLSKEAR